MAITLTVLPSDTYVKSGQRVDFVLKVVNTDGATRVLTQIKPRGSQQQMASNFSVTPLTDVNDTITNGSTAYFPFQGVFFANALRDSEAESVQMPFVVDVMVTNTSGVITSNDTSSATQMNVVPNLPNAYQPMLAVAPSLNFQSNKNAIYKVLPLV